MKWLVRGGQGPCATLEVGGRFYEALVGRQGVIEALEKREGDMKTPLGCWRVVEGWYRPDRVDRPVPQAGPMIWRPLTPEDGWCDAPADGRYNQPVPVGYGASHECMWRGDAAYDYGVVLDHNGAGGSGPVVPGAGSAIFAHLWRPGATHTAGCVALRVADWERLMDDVVVGGVVEVVRG